MNTIIRKPGKAAMHRLQLSQGKVRVNFDSPNGRRYGNHVRHCTPIQTKCGQVAVKAFGGIWTLAARLAPHRELDGSAMRSPTTGKCFRAHIRFDAVHVLWLDEKGISGTRNQIEDAVNMAARRNRPQA